MLKNKRLSKSNQELTYERMQEDIDDNYPRRLGEKPSFYGLRTLNPENVEQKHKLYDRFLKFKNLSHDIRSDIALEGNHAHRDKLLEFNDLHDKTKYFIGLHGNDYHRKKLKDKFGYDFHKEYNKESNDQDNYKR